ncbi:UbiD family decarboxylase [Amycolatopsis sp. NPDC051373]|uniref:UbiD family decarboxylase n=1 Tax=Amycolatopsis sp. NPDC051373 TaxID=3155801 RepID=UPI00344B51D6
MYNDYPQPHEDLRELVDRIDKLGQLVRVPEADPDLELGTLIELVAHRGGEGAPALLFDKLTGDSKGFRVLSGATNSAQRLALTMGFPRPGHPLAAVNSYRERMQTHQPIPPSEVDSGPVLQNILREGEIDLTAIPAPRLHELDGGRYLGTDDLIIMQDPDDGWVNIGTYRAMVQGPDRTGLWISPGKQGRQIREKYFAQGKPCPVLISCGHDPLLFLASGNELRWGLSEYDYAGGHRGAPIEVVRSELYGLPMPAAAEFVIEGELHPGETAPEGPFGEFTGYYAGGRSEQPVVRVRRVYHRDNPILTVASPIRPPSNFSYSKCVMKAGMV